MSALDLLDENQRQAASALRGPVAILAGAGTGKTRVITRRIAHGVEVGAYAPARVLALTFTAKAAGEMRTRLRGLGVPGVQARTFHAAAMAQLQYFWPILTGDAPPRIIDSKVRMLAQVADEARIRLSTAALRDVAAHIERRKTLMRSIDAYIAMLDVTDGPSRDQVASLMRAYETTKDDRRQIDFEDVLLACAGMLEAEPSVTRQVREQYRFFTVDEYQDVSSLQHHLLRLWLGERNDLCVVGDPNQTIYSFAGASAQHLFGFSREFGNAQVFRLEQNYRSAKSVLRLANAVIAEQSGALTLRPQPNALPGRRATIDAFDDERAEAEAVAGRIEQQLRAASASDIAVLYRSHAQSAEITEALGRRGVAVTVLGGKRFFEVPEVRQAILALRAEAVASPTGELVEQVRAVLRALGHTDTPPATGGAVRDLWEARAALLRLATEAEPGETMRSFADELQVRMRDQAEPVLESVTLSTLHAAKGLEWAHVHLIGMADGLLPIAHADGDDAALAEERRLAYVGITRATRSISLSWPRLSGQARRAKRPSRFVAGIGTDTLDVGTSGDAQAQPRR